MPIFLERFVLPLFAGAVILLAIANPMKFDMVQRVTGTLALIFAAYFVAHTVYKGNHPAPPPQPHFATANILGAVAGTPFVGLYESRFGKTVAPIDCLAIIQIVTKDKPIALNSILLEIRTPSGWMILRRIPAGSVTLYGGPLDNARRVAFEYPEIFSLLNRDLEPLRTFIGFAIYEYNDPDFRSTDAYPSFRVSLTNALGQTVQVESKDVGSADRLASGGWKLLLPGNERLDLTGFKVQRFLSQK